MKRVSIAIDDLRDAASLIQCAECLDQGQAFVFVFDGTKAVFLPDVMARESFIGSVLIDALTPGVGML